MKRSQFVALLWVFVLAVVSCSCSPAMGQDRRTVVSVADIGGDVTLVGLLGQPLGTMMEIRGTWRYPGSDAKDDSMRFIVSHVNGYELEKPVAFNRAQIEAVSKSGQNVIPDYREERSLEGADWTLRAYETGRFNVEPGGYRKELGKQVAARPYWYRPFTSELVGVFVAADDFRTKREAFKKKMMPYVGTVITVSGELGSGKIGEFVATEGGLIYVLGIQKGDEQKETELSRAAGKRATVTGTLQFGAKVPPARPDVSGIDEHFFIDIGKATIRLAAAER